MPPPDLGAKKSNRRVSTIPPPNFDDFDTPAPEGPKQISTSADGSKSSLRRLSLSNLEAVTTGGLKEEGPTLDAPDADWPESESIESVLPPALMEPLVREASSSTPPKNIPPPTRARRASLSSHPVSRRADPRADGPIRRVEVARSSLDAIGLTPDDVPAPDHERKVRRLVAELAQCSPDQDAPLRRQALALGPSILPKLAAAFPGAMWVDLSRPHGPLKSAHQLSALASTLTAFGPPAIPYVLRLLRAPHPTIRICATFVAGDLAHGDLVRPLAARLRDEIPAVRSAASVALQACRGLGELVEMRGEFVKSLRDRDAPQGVRLKAAWTLGQLRERESVPLLIEAMGTHDAELGQVVRRGLIRLTGQDHGRFRLRWKAWYGRHGMESRFEWLVSALTQRDDALRAKVVDELILLTRQAPTSRLGAATRDSAKELQLFYRNWESSQPS